MSAGRISLRHGCGFCLCLLLLYGPRTAPAAAAQDREKGASGTSTSAFGPLQKSLLIPGWGQLVEKRYVEGIAFLSAEVICLAGAIVNNHRGNQNYGLYQKAASSEEAIRYRQIIEKYDTRRNEFLLAAAAVWAANLLDIYLIVTGKEKKERAFTLKVERGANKTISLAVAYRF